MTNYLIKYVTSKGMRINHNICNNARMRKRNRSRMRKKIGHAELLSNGATARYTQEPSQKKRPQIQTIKNIWRTNRNQPQTTNIPHLTSIQTKNTKKTKKKKTHIWEHTYTKLQTHVKDNVFGRMIAREFCKYILTNSKKFHTNKYWILIVISLTNIHQTMHLSKRYHTLIGSPKDQTDHSNNV